MKISELIVLLERYRQLYGDLPVVFDEGDYSNGDIGTDDAEEDDFVARAARNAKKDAPPDRLCIL